jgi:hypothetical protein
MELVIEAPTSQDHAAYLSFSVAHYGLQNGDPMLDPEMCFDLGLAGGADLNPFYWRNNYVAVEPWSRNIVRDHYVYPCRAA